MDAPTNSLRFPSRDFNGWTSGVHQLGAVKRQLPSYFRICPAQMHVGRQAQCGDVFPGQLWAELDPSLDVKGDQVRIESRIQVRAEKEAVVDVQTLGIGFAIRPGDDCRISRK